MNLKHYQVQLDQDPKTKWLEIIQDHKIQIKTIYDQLETQNSSLLSSLGSFLIQLSSGFGYVLHREELQSIAMECKIPFGKVVLLQIMYELSACCTSGVFLVDQTSVHLRTMDWPLPDLKHITITIDFMKGTKHVYSAVTWAGYVGCLTAMKPDLGSISMNYRRGNGTLLDNLRRLVSSKWPAGYLIRYVMEHTDSVNDMIQCLSDYELVAPCYFIVCGDRPETCVNIIRERTQSLVRGLVNERLVQTNIDHHIDNPTLYGNILYSIERYVKTHQIISEIQEHSEVEHLLFDKFSVYPIINEETIYLCVMIPLVNYLECRLPNN